MLAGRAPSCADHFVPVQAVTSRIKFFSETLFPRASGIKRCPCDAQNVRRKFDVARFERVDLRPAQASDEVAEFEDDVLSSARVLLSPLPSTLVVRR